MLSLLVISDIHATSGRIEEDDCESFFSTLPEYNGPTRNPFNSISKVISDSKLSVDAVLCPGDLADKADPVAQERAWSNLAKLKQDTNAKLLLGTVGNHDIDSRGVFSEFDPKSNLQSLDPSFPGLSNTENDHYWARNFVITELQDVRFVSLNSCAFHGIHSDSPDVSKREYLNGRVSAKTLESLKIALATASVRPKLNVLLVHHHIYKNQQIQEKDYSTMKNGEILAEALQEMNNGPWLIIHGHQHHPNLFYSSGNASSAVVFSAGSLSKKLSGNIASRAVNQFYHISLPTNEYKEIGWEPCGIIRSWQWTDFVGWRPTIFHSPDLTRVPHGCGFGCRKQSQTWATEIEELVLDSPGKRLSWEQITRQLPALTYVLPADVQKVTDALKSSGRLKVSKNDLGFPDEIGIPLGANL